MRILFLTSRLPYPPNRGDRLRAFHFIKSLSRQHDVHLISFISNEIEKVNIEPLRSYCKDVQVVTKSKLQSILSVALNIWKPLPLQALYYRSSSMQALIDQKLREQPFDLIYVHLFRMAPFVVKTQQIYRVIDLTDVISREIKRSLSYRGVTSRLLYALEGNRIRRYESFVGTKFEEIWLISEADKIEMINICHQANIEVVTNGIDSHQFFPNGDSPQLNSIIFTGHFGVAHNIDAALQLAYQVLPLVQNVIPGSTLSLVGAEPSPEVLKLDKLPGVRVTGFVEDLNIYLNRASVFAAPLRFAAGIQNKVLEAMAAARPIITTSLVNEGLGATPGEHLIIANTPQEMAQQIITLFQNPESTNSLGRSARRFVISRYSWDKVLQRVDQIEKLRNSTDQR